MAFVQRIARSLRRLRTYLPEGGRLPDHVWLARHRVMLVVLWLHVTGLPLYGHLRGYSAVHCLLDTAPLAVVGLVGTQPHGGRTLRSVMTSLGLMGAAALVVHFSGGVIEAHFHFFVMITLLSLYQDWIPFLTALGFVVLHHGIMGTLYPDTVYNHLDAEIHPWRWAFIHGGYVLAAAAANMYVWRTSEIDMQHGTAVFRAMFNLNPYPMWVLDPETLAFLAVNEAAVTRYGYSDAEFLRMRITDIRAPEHASRVAEQARQPGRRMGVWEHRSKDGQIIHAEVHSQPLDFHGRDARLVVIGDVTGRVTLEAQLRHRASHDVLTGLANRDLFHEHLQRAVSHGDGRVAVLSLDVDDFKAVNDAHGHGAGDALLIEVANRLRTSVRPEDVSARMGGDEYAVVLQGVSATEAAEIARRVLSAMLRPICIGHGQVLVTASVGVAAGAEGHVDGDELLRRADIATYEAKAAGKCRVETFEPGMQSRVLRRIEVAADLRRALERDELFVRYQPVVDLATGEIRGIEALVRWRHPDRGVVSPADFIPVAEETGLIVPIGAWVLQESCRQLQEWHAGVPPDRRIALSVNVSSRQLQESDFVASVLELVTSTGIDPAQLVLEVTESSVVDDLVQAHGCLERLRRHGIRIAIDDFGSGYSSLGYLRGLPLDVIKIDRMFVAGLSAGDLQGRELALAVVRLVDTLGIPTVAEGIETAEELAYVRALGVDFAQGYLLARPVDAATFTDLLHGGGFDIDALLAEHSPATRETPPGAPRVVAPSPTPGRAPGAFSIAASPARD